MSVPAVPKLKVPQTKLEKLAEDLRQLEISHAVVNNSTQTAVPAFQRQGYLEKLGHTRMKWFKRFFVLRDSFLLSYNLQKSDYTVEPRSAVHLGNATIQLLEHAGKEFCFLITTMQRDRFLFAAENAEERRQWVSDLEQARKVIHANMIKLAVENRCLAEEKGAANVALDNSTSALAIFSNEQYIQNTPITGGAEGWLRTLGFNPDEAKRNSLLKNKKALQKLYFILRDSHLLMFQGGDMLTKPRGVMFLLSTRVEVLTAEDAEGDFPFRVTSPQFGDEITLFAGSNKMRKRWVEAVRVGARVTFPDFRLLLKEHEILASVTMTPRAAPPSAPNAPASVDTSQQVAPPLLFEDFDLLGEQLDPGTQQAFDAAGAPIVRNPDGKLTTTEGDILAPSTPRFNTSGQQLDPFNRPLPPGAVPMFTEHGVPIGVGPDGNHYLPDGTTVSHDAPHYDANGTALGHDTIQAANAVATDLNVAIKVRAMLKSEGARDEAVDVLGRTFRATDGGDGFVNADGDVVPLASARRIETSSGQMVDYHKAVAAAPAAASTEKELHVRTTDDQGDEKDLGIVHVDDRTTLKDVRRMITSEIKTDFEDFVFLINFIPLLKYEENDRLASACLPEVFIRGNELKKVARETKFTAKVSSLHQYEQEKKKEAEEFTDVMARIRQGKFLRNTNMSMMGP